MTDHLAEHMVLCQYTNTNAAAAAAALRKSFTDRPNRPVRPATAPTGTLAVDLRGVFLFFQHTLERGAGRVRYVRRSARTWGLLDKLGNESAGCSSHCSCLLSGCSREQAPTPQAPPAPKLDVVELSAADARDRMAAGTLTSRALTQAYLDRIAKIDDAGPRSMR